MIERGASMTGSLIDEFAGKSAVFVLARSPDGTSRLRPGLPIRKVVSRAGGVDRHRRIALVLAKKRSKEAGSRSLVDRHGAAFSCSAAFAVHGCAVIDHAIPSLYPSMKAFSSAEKPLL